MALKVFRAVMPHVICIFSVLLAAPHLSVGYATDIEYFKAGMERFGNNLFEELAQEYPDKNIVFSPFSIQTALTMTRMGAEGQTADKLDEVLALKPQNTEVLANNYQAILAKYENSDVLKVANKMYVMTGYSVQDTFNRLLTEKFYSKVDSINFAKNEEAAHTINSWVEEKTNNLIKDLVKPKILDATTRLVLVNAIHFKGSWVHPFPDYATIEDYFFSEKGHDTVQMMSLTKTFKYGDLSDLGAQVVELPYKDSDISMLFIVPHTENGLKQLERKLKHTSLAEITQQMTFMEVIVEIPKFKAEFEAELSEPLSKMGLERMFSGDAEFGKMLESAEGLKVSAVVHKAFIEVDETGTEAAAATYSVNNQGGVPYYRWKPHIIANRPFCYVLKNADNLTLFKGTYKGSMY